MYGIPQAVIIANDARVQHLTPNGYQPLSKNPVLWTHESLSINFTLIVDDFGVKYPGK